MDGTRAIEEVRGWHFEPEGAVAWPMRGAAAEIIGTFVLVFGGVGSAVIAGEEIGFLGVSLAFGLSLLAMVYAIGPISGCHINPAVTLGIIVRGKMDTPRGRALLARAGGRRDRRGRAPARHRQGAAGGYDATPRASGRTATANTRPAVPVGAAFLAEVVLTFFLVFTVLASTDRIAHVGLRRCRDRPRADAHPPRRHSDHEHVGQPGAQHRPGDLRRRLGDRTAVAVHRGAAARRAARRRCTSACSRASSAWTRRSRPSRPTPPRRPAV